MRDFLELIKIGIMVVALVFAYQFFSPIISPISSVINFVGNVVADVGNFLFPQTDEYPSDMNIEFFYLHSDGVVHNSELGDYVGLDVVMIITIYTDEECQNREYVKIVKRREFDPFLQIQYREFWHFYERSDNFVSFPNGWTEMSENDFLIKYQFTYCKISNEIYRIELDKFQINEFFRIIAVYQRFNEIEDNSTFDLSLRIYDFKLKQSDEWVIPSNNCTNIIFQLYFNVVDYGHLDWVGN